MSQTDTPRQTEDATGRRGLGRRRRDNNGGDRCQMCRQTVVVDLAGRCPLGHQVVTSDEMAVRADEALASEVDEPIVLEIDLDHDPASLAPLGFALSGGGGALPQRVVPRAEPAPAPLAVNEPVSTPSDADLTRQLLARSAADRNRRWVPGIVPTDLVLESPTLLPDRALGRRLAQPDDHPLPVMEPTPPLPDPPPQDGPAVARALFHCINDDSAGLAFPEPPDRPAPEVRRPAPAIVAPAPVHAQQSALGAAGTILDRPWVTAADLSPSAASVLDVDGLPDAPARVEPVFEAAPMESEVIASRGPAQWLAAALFLAVLATAAWYLATTL